jgi:hypothetical protein
VQALRRRIATSDLAVWWRLPPISLSVSRTFFHILLLSQTIFTKMKSIWKISWLTVLRAALRALSARAVWICRSSRRVKSRVFSCRAIKYAAVRSEIISTSHSIFVPLCVAYEKRYSRKEVYGSAREELMNCSHPVTHGFSV